MCDTLSRFSFKILQYALIFDFFHVFLPRYSSQPTPEILLSEFCLFFPHPHVHFFPSMNPSIVTLVYN